jgi:hypothetical protein
MDEKYVHITIFLYHFFIYRSNKFGIPILENQLLQLSFLIIIFLFIKIFLMLVHFCDFIIEEHLDFSIFI